MDKIEKIKEWVNKQKKEELARNSIGVITGKALFVDANELLSFLCTLSEEPDTPEFPETFEICLYDGRTPNKENCNECSTTCSVRKEEPDKSLEEAAEEYARLDEDGVWKDGGKYNGFIAGAEWQKEHSFTHHETNESLEEAVTHQMEDDGDVDDFIRKGLDETVLKYAQIGAEWQASQMIEHIKLAYGKVSMNPFDCSEAFEELLNKFNAL